MDTNKGGILLTLFIVVSICYILYSNGDEKSPQTGLWYESDYNGLNALHRKADDDYDDIGKDVEYVEDFVDVVGYKIFYTYSKITVKNQDKPKFPVLLLHGAAYQAQTWKALGTLQFLAKEGYFPVAIDLPRFGKSKTHTFSGDESEFMTNLMANLIRTIPVTLQETAPAIISPSMSGRFSLPYIFKHEKEVKAFIPIAPVNRFSANDFKSLTLPILIVCGELDKPGHSTSSIIAHAKHSQFIEIENAGHAAYLAGTETFHDELKKFLGNL